MCWTRWTLDVLDAFIWLDIEKILLFQHLAGMV